jgi:hypothetical protein
MQVNAENKDLLSKLVRERASKRLFDGSYSEFYLKLAQLCCLPQKHLFSRLTASLKLSGKL